MSEPANVMDRFSVVIAYAILSNTDRAYQRNSDGTHKLLLCVTFVAAQMGVGNRSSAQLIHNVFARYHQIPQVLQKMGINIAPCPGAAPNEYEPWVAANFRVDYPHRDLRFDDHHLARYWLYLALVFRNGSVIDFRQRHYIFLGELTYLIGCPRYQGSLRDAHNTWILHNAMDARDEVEKIYALYGVRIAKQIYTPSWCIEYM